MKIGLLPLYIRLYDELCPEYHDRAQRKADLMKEKLEELGYDVVASPLCREADEISAAVRTMEKSECRVIVTLHAAYSPSLEAVDALCGTSLPLVVMDTTPDYEFGFDFGDKLMLNHGIHGVQDMCNMLLQRGKPFLIRAGHCEQPDFMVRMREAILAAGMAYALTHARVGSVGGAFEGMGDFRVPEGTFGMKVIPYTPGPVPDEGAVKAEMEADKSLCRMDPQLPESVHYKTEESCLGLRRWIENNNLDAFTVNFTRCNRSSGWEVVPFLECSKAMARGIGYAGEGDVLTALFCGALLKEWKNTTFTEMFCPDWKGNRIFLSHMGEMNLSLMARKPYLSMRRWKFGDAGDQALATGCLRSGKAVLANLAPGPDGQFTLIAARVAMMEQTEENLADLRGWFAPPEGLSIGSFLEQYSRLGGTHHLVLCYDGELESLRDLAHLMKWDFREIHA